MRHLMFWGKMVAIAATAMLVTACANTSPRSAYDAGWINWKTQKAGFQAIENPQPLLKYAAEKASNPSDIIRFNRAYADFSVKRGNLNEANKAYERAALAGDAVSGHRLAVAQFDEMYTPDNIIKVARKVYLPLTKDKRQVTVRILLARLLRTGALRGPDFKTSDVWLEEAASQGNTTALKALAQQAELRGDIDQAANFYAKADSGSRSERALRQARRYYLGQGNAVNVKLGHSWMRLARKLDKRAAGRLAARIVRVTQGKRDALYLTGIANDAGFLIASSGAVSRFKAAKTEKERQAILQQLKLSADNGNANAAYDLATLYRDSGDNLSQIAHLLLVANKGGVKAALKDMIKLLLRAGPGDTDVKDLFARIEVLAKSGNVEAARALASLYSIGGYKPANVALHRSWLRVAADAGDVKSQYELGVELYENGGNDATKAQALRYLRKAAKSGDAFALAYLKTKK